LEGLDTQEVVRQERVKESGLQNEFTQPEERGFFGKARDFATSVIGGGKVAEGAGKSIASRETSEQLTETSLARGDIAFNIGQRIKDKQERGEDTSRLQNSLKDLIADGAIDIDTLNKVQESLPTTKEVIGSAIRLAGTLAAPTIAGKAVGGIGAGTGLVGGAVQGAKIGAAGGAIEGAIQGGGLAVENDGSIAKGVLGGALFGTVAGGVGGALIGGVTGKVTANRELKSQIRQKLANNPDSTVAKYVVNGQGKIVKDPVAKELIKQGADEGTVSLMKGASATDKAKMSSAMDILEKSKVDKKFAATNRPSDVIGDSVVDRFNVVKKANSEAGKQLDDVAKSLKGNKFDAKPAVQSFIDDLDELGVKFNNGKANFKGSSIEGVKPAENLINRIVKRTETLGDDAFEYHNLKKFIDEQVSFGKTSEGLSGNTERVVKGLRRNIDSLLDTNFPAYNDVNTTYSTTRGAIDDFLSSAGSKFDINAAGANKQLGTLSRRVLSNAQSRVQVLNSLDNLQTVAESLGGKFDDDLITQIAFINEIETLFGSSAKTSLQGSTEKAIKTGASVANRLRKAEGLGGLALDTVASGIEKAGGVNEENLIKALRAILTS